MTGNQCESDWLGRWVQRRHWTPAAVQQHRVRFDGDALRLLQIPDFLDEDIAARVADFLEREANFTRQYAVRSAATARDEGGDAHERLVSEEEWHAAPPEARFLRFGVGPGQPRRMSPGWMRFLALRAAIHDERFADYLEALTGLPLGPVSSLTAHAMGPGDMLAPHSDVNLRRRLAFILYLTPAWHRRYGGALLITGLDGALTTIEPTFNTLVVFDVTAHRSHRVEAIADAAGETRRLSLSGWFDHPLPTAGDPRAAS